MPFVHYDLATAERTIREAFAGAKVIAEKAIAEGRADPGFVAAQHQFFEAQVQFSLAQMRSMNAGLSASDVACAAGLMIGQLLYSLNMSTSSFPEEQRDLVRSNIEAGMSGPSDNCVEVAEFTISPMQGGTA